MARRVVILGKLLWCLGGCAPAVVADEEQRLNIQACTIAQPSCRDAAGGICLRRLADVLEPDLFLELRRAALRGDEGTHWFIRGASPQNIFQHVAIKVAIALGLGQEHSVSIEYWTKGGLPEEPFHFDSEEQYEECAMFPYVSSILYLDDLGPPTIILSKTLSDEGFADASAGPANDTSYLAWPAPNHLLMFSGDLFHGIHVHDGAEDASKSPGAHALRAIVLFNFWQHRVGESKEADDSAWRSSEEPRAQGVPMVVQDCQAEKERWSVTARETFGGTIDFELKYRMPGGRTSTHGCTLDQRTWRRSCSETGEPPLLVAVPGSLEEVVVLSTGVNFTGGLLKPDAGSTSKAEL